MTQQIFDFEGTDGATLSGTNIAIQGSGGSATFSAADAKVGSTGAHFTTQTTPTAQVKSARLTITTPSKTMAFSGCLKTPPSLPATGVRYSMASLRDTAPSVAMRIEIDEFGQIGIEGKAGGFFGASATGIPVNTWFRYQVELVVGTTTTPSAGNSTVTAKIYTGTNLATLSGTGVVNKTNFDAGTLTIGAADVGALTAAMPDVAADYVMLEDGRTTEFGALPTGTVATANAGADHYQQTGLTVTLTGAASTGTATGVTYLWENLVKPEWAATPSITNPAAQTTTATGIVDGYYQWRLTVTNPGTTPSTDIVESYIYPLSNDDVKIRSVTRATGITNQGGATDTAALNDASSATYHQWPDNPSGQVDELTMAPYGPGPIGYKETGYWTTPDTGTAVTRTVEWHKEDGSTLQAYASDVVTGSGISAGRVLPGGLNADVTAATEATHALSTGSLTTLGTAQIDRRALHVLVKDTV